jgi:putative glutathione S-transferase
MPKWERTRPDDPSDDYCGWMFSDPGGGPIRNSIGLGGPFPSSRPGNEPDPHFGARSVRELYERVGQIGGKFTVPTLFDKKSRTIVSNESSEIIQMLNSEFNDLAGSPEIDLQPDHLKSAMEEVDGWVYSTVNNGVYRSVDCVSCGKCCIFAPPHCNSADFTPPPFACPDRCGFAKSQEAYDEAIEELIASFDRLEETLSSRRYIAGDSFTLSDIRLFVTLIRFDEVYTVYFKCNTRSVSNSPTLLNYCRDIYQMRGVAETVDMEQIKEHYYCSHPNLNKWSIIPRGPDFIKLLAEPHNRDVFDYTKGCSPKVSPPSS